MKILHLLSCALVASSCGPEPDRVSSGANAAAADPRADSISSVAIVAPTEQSVQEERDVAVRLNSTGLAGDPGTGTAHLHLYLDMDLGDVSGSVPTAPGRNVHLGVGSRAHVFEDVASGVHRLIAVVTDEAHVPLRPLVVDTVNFVIE